MKIARTIALFTIVFFLAAHPAHAYLDPGTGSYVLQILAAALFGGMFALKTWWREIRHFVSSVVLRKETTSEKPSQRKK